MRSMHVFAALLAACGLCGLAAAGCAKPPVVQDFDVTAYMGPWYEYSVSAGFRKKFEKDFICTTANYHLNEDGTVKVLNSGSPNGPDGPFVNATGKAKIVDKGTGHLEVSFFGPFYGPYLITQLYGDAAHGYSVAVIYSCTDGLFGQDDFWVLSRTPELPASVNYTMIMDKAKSQGIAVDTLDISRTTQQPACHYPWE